MSFESNVGKSPSAPGPGQCEMVAVHHPDCTCASCERHLDVQCLEPFVGWVPDHGDTRVCGRCAMTVEHAGKVVTYREETCFVLVHPEMGIYLGSAMGLGLWTKLDPCQQPAAVTFTNRVQADQVMRSWDGGRPDGVVIWPVVPDDGHYATVTACVAAGLEAWDPGAGPS